MVLQATVLTRALLVSRVAISANLNPGYSLLDLRLASGILLLPIVYLFLRTVHQLLAGVHDLFQVYPIPIPLSLAVWRQSPLNPCSVLSFPFSTA